MSIKVVIEGASLGEDHRINTVLTKFNNQTTWFERFVRGVELWVGSKSSPDQEIRIEVMKFLIEKI